MSSFVKWVLKIVFLVSPRLCSNAAWLKHMEFCSKSGQQVPAGTTSRTATLARECCLHILQGQARGLWYCWLLGSGDIGGRQPYGMGAGRRLSIWRDVPILHSQSVGAAHLSETQTVRQAGEGPTGKGGFSDRGVLHCQQLRLSGLIKPSITCLMPGI